MGGKKGKVGVLGRALIRQHNQLVRESKEKGRALGLQRRRVLVSVTDVSDIDTVLQKAEEADRVYTIGNPSPDVLVTLEPSSDGDATIVEEKMQLQKQEEDLYASSLQIPRRPPWNTHMSVEELDANEKQAFLVWRRNLARLEENDKLVLTPFEKNLDIWRQLWRVLERSDLLVMVVDGRDPLFYRCPDLENYAREIDEHKKTLLLVNKADLLPVHIRQRWADYFNQQNILFVFWSAKAASAALEGKKLSNAIEEKSMKKHENDKEIQGANSDALDTKIYGRDDLLARLQSEAEAIAAHRRHGDKETQEANSDAGSTANPVIVGFVGYPNVGKSSTINALVGQKRTGVTSTPGKTKHFQTLIISDELVLCDCPGLVFPSFSSSRYEMIASGVLPIDRMTEHRQAVQVVADCVARNALESVYNIILPRPKTYEVQSRPPLSSELLRAYCSSRGYVSSSGLPDETRAARQILKDYIDGKLPHFKLPPEAIDDDMEVNAASGLTDESSLEDSETDDGDSIIEDDQSALNISVDTDQHNLIHVLDDLESFDLASGLPSKKAAAPKNPNKTYKHHKKPQRKKDRTWRVGNINEDGMPVVRVFQKPTVNLSSIEPSA